MYGMLKTRTGYFRVKDRAEFEKFVSRIITSNHEPVEILTAPGNGGHIALMSKGYIWAIHATEYTVNELIHHECMKDKVLQELQSHLDPWSYCVLEELTDSATVMDVGISIITPFNIEYFNPLDDARQKAGRLLEKFHTEVENRGS